MTEQFFSTSCSGSAPQLIVTNGRDRSMMAETHQQQAGFGESKATAFMVANRMRESAPQINARSLVQRHQWVG
jgi:hypothetical protein